LKIKEEKRKEKREKTKREKKETKKQKKRNSGRCFHCATLKGFLVIYIKYSLLGKKDKAKHQN